MFGFSTIGMYSIGEAGYVEFIPPDPPDPPVPGVGLATKTQAQLLSALNKIVEAMYHVHQLAQSGIPIGDTRLSAADAAVSAAVVALLALQ